MDRKEALLRWNTSTDGTQAAPTIKRGGQVYRRGALVRCHFRLLELLHFRLAVPGTKGVPKQIQVVSGSHVDSIPEDAGVAVTASPGRFERVLSFGSVLANLNRSIFASDKDFFPAPRTGEAR